ncbi:MAG: C40 family peptidase [Pacificimonas sp.]
MADSALEGIVAARRFAVPVPHRLTEGGSEMMRAEPTRSATAVSELLPGERFDIIDDAEGWAWGYSAHDHYVGYVRSENLRSDGPPRTHRITTPTALCFSRPDIKSDVAHILPMRAEVAAEDFNDDFMRLRNGTFVHRRHIGGADVVARDAVLVAEDFLGTPYRWGGRRRAGIDCSGLIQIALSACGISAPRDSDMQREQLGSDVTGQKMKRADLVFFPGHVGMMVDAERMIHANAHWMTTMIEPLKDVTARLKPEHDEPLVAVKRL